MNEFMDRYFGVFDQRACMYFLFISMIFFFSLLFTFFYQIMFLIKNYKTVDSIQFISGFLMLINLFLIYFVNRLFYSMCSKSLA